MLYIGAPESFKHDSDWENTPVTTSRHADIWSFVCILSEAIVWMGMNYDGLQDYRKARLAHESRSNHPGLGDCFHDGIEVLDLVPQWHRKAMQNLRPRDRITAQVVEIIEQYVFQIRRGGLPWKINAKELSLLFDRAVRGASESSEMAHAPCHSVGTQTTPNEELQTLLDTADESLRSGDTTKAGENFEKAHQIWDKNFSSFLAKCLGDQLRIYLGLNKVLIRREKSLSLKGSAKERGRKNAGWLARQADIIQRYLKQE
jgi:hypothetical protein